MSHRGRLSEGDHVQASRSPGRRLWGLNSGAEAFETSTFTWRWAVSLGQRLQRVGWKTVSFPYLPEEENAFKKLKRLNIWFQQLSTKKKKKKKLVKLLHCALYAKVLLVERWAPECVLNVSNFTTVSVVWKCASKYLVTLILILGECGGPWAASVREIPA